MALELLTKISTTLCHPSESSRNTLSIHWIALEDLNIVGL